MVDLATRLQARTDAAAVFGVPFDWRLVTPAAPTDYPYTDYTNDTGGPKPGVDRLATYALEREDTLATAVTLSLFTDRRAGSDQWGSALWLVYAGKAVVDVLEQARFAAQESLAWLERDGIASRVVVVASWAGAQADRMAVRATIYKPDQVRPVYDVLWGTSIRRWASEG